MLRGRAQDLALLGDDEELFVVVHLSDGDDLTVFLGHLEVLQAQAAPALDTVCVEVGSLRVALLRDREEGASRLDYFHGDDGVAFPELDAANTVRGAPHGPRVSLREANRHTVTAADEDLARAVGQ